MELHVFANLDDAEENFARATEMKTEETADRGGVTFTIYDYVHHLVSGQSLGLGLHDGQKNWRKDPGETP